jgi:hypothetical protein
VLAALDQQAEELQRNSAQLEQTLCWSANAPGEIRLPRAESRAIATTLSSLVESMPPGGSFAVAMVDVDSEDR